MLNKQNIILLLFQILFGYTIFDHVQDLKIPSATYIASNGRHYFNTNIGTWDNDDLNNSNLYNFSNPACNLYKDKYLYSSFGYHFNGILKSQQLFFTLDTDFFDKLDFAVLRTSIDNIYNTTDAWNDNGDGIIDISEIDYNQITTFNHNNLGLIISNFIWIYYF